MEKKEIGYCEKLAAKLDFAADMVEEAGDCVLGQLIRNATEMLTTDEDLDMVEERDRLKDGIERADAIITVFQTNPDPDCELLNLAAAWRRDFGSEP